MQRSDPKEVDRIGLIVARSAVCRSAIRQRLGSSSAAARSRGSCSSSRTRTSQQRSARKVERCDRLVAPHGRELAKKLVYGFTAFEVVEERLNRNTCANEDRRSP